MATGLIDYHGDGEHTHAQKTQPIVWLLALGLVILALSVAVLAFYLSGRATLANGRQKDTTEAICVVLNALPPDLAPSKERAAFRQAYQLEHCKPLPAPNRRATTPPATVTATARATATAPPPVTLSPHPQVTVTHMRKSRPHPTVTKTKTVKPQPSHHPSHSPEPSPSCLLGIRTTLTCPKK